MPVGEPRRESDPAWRPRIVSNPAVLRGIAWNHSRALPPLVATAQRYEELHPAVEIRWEKRTLHEFGHVRLTPLARDYDLLIVDHPMMGEAYATRTLIDLADLVPVPATLGRRSRVTAMRGRSLRSRSTQRLQAQVILPASSRVLTASRVFGLTSWIWRATGRLSCQASMPICS